MRNGGTSLRPREAISNCNNTHKNQQWDSEYKQNNIKHQQCRVIEWRLQPPRIHRANGNELKTDQPAKNKKGERAKYLPHGDMSPFTTAQPTLIEAARNGASAT